MIDLPGAAQDINKMLSHHDFEGGNVRVSEGGIVTICVHGLCIVRDLKGWHELAARCGEIKSPLNPKAAWPFPEKITVKAVAMDGSFVVTDDAIHFNTPDAAGERQEEK